MSLLVVVQAREHSTRFPGKIFQDIAGQTMLARVLERASKLGPATVAFPPADLPEEDVLGRFVRVAQQAPEVDTFVRITGDTPLLDPGVGGFVLNLYRDRQNDLDFVGTAPDMDGLDVEVFSRTALRIADHNARGRDREHVTSWMRRHLGAFLVNMAPAPLRWSVDTQDDLAFVRRVYEECDLCARGVTRHTNASGSIGGAHRVLVLDLHHVDDGGLAECRAADTLRTRVGGKPYVSA